MDAQPAFQQPQSDQNKTASPPGSPTTPTAPPVLDPYIMGQINAGVNVPEDPNDRDYAGGILRETFSGQYPFYIFIKYFFYTIMNIIHCNFF